MAFLLIWTTQFLLISCFMLAFTKASLITCETTKQCLLYQNPGNCEYQCPPDQFDVVVHVEPETKVTIDCYNFTLQPLPNINVGNVEEIDIRRCPLPENSFSTILNHLGVNQTNMLKFGHSKLENESITSEYFEGFSSLRVLSMPYNQLQYLQEDAFKYTPNLVNIDLMKNKVQLTPNIFQYAPKLNVIDLSLNQLDSLPKGIFMNLKKLKILHLWGNQLTNLEPDVFESLTNLSSLELSNNRLANIPENIFFSLKNLTEINLSMNKLRVVPEMLFSNNHLIRNIKINRNPDIVLPNGLFSHSLNLEIIEISSCNLNSIPNDLFRNSSKIQTIDLQQNQFKTLPQDIFKDLTNLKKLYLNSNQLSSLPDTIFISLTGLESLFLQNNKLTTINERIFKNLINLKKLDLENNELGFISNWSFDSVVRISDINLSHNKVTFEQNAFGFSPFNKCSELKIINLSHNFITDIPQDLFLTKLKLESLDLSFNNLTIVEMQVLQKTSNVQVLVNLANNQITEIDLRMAEIIARNQPNLDAYSSNAYSVVVDLENNPIVCDCHAYDLARYVQGMIDPRVLTLIQLKTDSLKCMSPPELMDIPVNLIQPNMLSCSVDELVNYTGCPDSCACRWRPWDKAIVFECNDRNMTKVPKLTLPIVEYRFLFDFNQTEVHLEGNSLISGPNSADEGYENVTRLFMSDNHIEKLDWIPPNIEELKLHNNNLTVLKYDVLAMLNESQIRNLTLNNNPWRCDCGTTNLTNYLRQHLKQVDPVNIRCANGKLLVHLNENDLCHTYTVMILVASTISAIVFFIAAILAALYYRYQQEIKVWLFAHNMCLWWVTEEEIDKEKLYDAFLSFSHKDEDFVINNILSVLESGPQPYKVCVHYRNWIPGEFISEQIVKSVEESRRTLVVLSPSFLESVWGKMEFRTAHQQALNEGRARVIIILYGDIDLNSDLDTELKAYINTNTYVKWGDPWFWRKLKYAMPHSQKRLQVDSHVHSQKHANIMIKLDDKFSLINTPTTPNNGSTPPVITLDPKLLKDHPLNFTPSNNMTTPPAESGLNPLILTGNT